MTIGYWLATFRAQFQREPKHSRAFRRRPQALVATQIERLEAVTLLSGIPPVDDLFPTTIANQAITIDVLTNDYVLPDKPCPTRRSRTCPELLRFVNSLQRGPY